MEYGYTFRPYIIKRRSCCFHESTSLKKKKKDSCNKVPPWTLIWVSTTQTVLGHMLSACCHLYHLPTHLSWFSTFNIIYLTRYNSMLTCSDSEQSQTDHKLRWVALQSVQVPSSTHTHTHAWLAGSAAGGLPQQHQWRGEAGEAEVEKWRNIPGKSSTPFKVGPPEFTKDSKKRDRLATVDKI